MVWEPSGAQLYCSQAFLFQAQRVPKVSVPPHSQHPLPSSAWIRFPSRYLLGNDPAQWLDVHPETGIITAKAPLDRESPFVQNNTYTAIVLAADDGKPCGRMREGRAPPLVPPPLPTRGWAIKCSFVELSGGGCLRAAHVRGTWWPAAEAARS